MFDDWRTSDCQPNYWVSGTVTPDPSKSCGPYAPTNTSSGEKSKFRAADIHYQNHDTIAMVVISETGQIAAGVR
jgi:N4-(beta-N-acetylglucosaminyl)-L-asparaginase